MKQQFHLLNESRNNGRWVKRLAGPSGRPASIERKARTVFRELPEPIFVPESTFGVSRCGKHNQTPHSNRRAQRRQQRIKRTNITHPANNTTWKAYRRNDRPQRNVAPLAYNKNEDHARSKTTISGASTRNTTDSSRNTLCHRETAANRKMWPRITQSLRRKPTMCAVSRRTWNASPKTGK